MAANRARIVGANLGSPEPTASSSPTQRSSAEGLALSLSRSCSESLHLTERGEDHLFYELDLDTGNPPVLAEGPCNNAGSDLGQLAAAAQISQDRSADGIKYVID